jgi:hypothetical protein
MKAPHRHAGQTKTMAYRIQNFFGSARQQATSLCSLREEIEKRAHRGNHAAPRRENSVHDSGVSLE